MESGPRIFYAAGPGDIVGTYTHWKEGRDDPSQVAVTYSGQFFETIKELGGAGYAVSYCPRKAYVNDGQYKVLHRTIPFQNGPGPLYHLGQIWSAIRMAMSAIAFKADIAVVSDGAHWFALEVLRWFGVKVVPTLHCTLWKKHAPMSGLSMKIRKLNARFFRRKAFAVMSLSSDITEQVKEMVGTEQGPPIVAFLPHYRETAFGGMAQPPSQPPFRVFFAGRIEPNKGVFDLLAVAKSLREKGLGHIEFDLCGSGSVLEPLRRQTEEAGLEDHFRLHGHCTKPVMRAMFERSHVVIAPTTTDFIEGFNKVVAEGVLAGRPVITSSVCPALSYVAAGVVEVPPDDVKGYEEAIIKLSSDRQLYETKRAGALSCRGQFLDKGNSWSEALKRVVALWRGNPG